MSLDRSVVQALAEHVDRAQREATAIHKLTDDHPGMTVEDAYDVRDALRRIAIARGERIVGFKAGLTSPAKMKQMGVSVPGFAYLTSAMSSPEGAAIDASTLIHPKVEPEVAFVTKSALRGPHCDVEAVLEATDFVLPAVEVIDSRYENFRFDLPSVLADNSSAARYVTGGRARRARDLDLRTLGVVLEKNGEIATIGASAAVLGHPARAVGALVEHLHTRGEELPAGSFVLSGGITEAVAVAAGDFVTVRIQELGSVSFRFV